MSYRQRRLGNVTRIERRPLTPQETAQAERAAVNARVALAAAEKEREQLLDEIAALRKETAKECRRVLTLARFQAQQKLDTATERAARVLDQVKKELDLAGTKLDEVTRREKEIAHGWEKLEDEQSRTASQAANLETQMKELAPRLRRVEAIELEQDEEARRLEREGAALVVLQKAAEAKLDTAAQAAKEAQQQVEDAEARDKESLRREQSAEAQELRASRMLAQATKEVETLEEKAVALRGEMTTAKKRLELVEKRLEQAEKQEKLLDDREQALNSQEVEIMDKLRKASAEKVQIEAERKALERLKQQEL